MLIQLDKLGFDLKVPVVLMNYGGFYDNLLNFLDDTVEYGVFAVTLSCSLITTGSCKLGPIYPYFDCM